MLLLLGAWVTLLAFNSTMVLLPISIGRVIFTSFSRLPITRGAKCNGEKSAWAAPESVTSAVSRDPHSSPRSVWWQARIVV